MHRSNSILSSLLIVISMVYCIGSAPTTKHPLEIVSASDSYSSSRSMSLEDHLNKVLSFWTEEKLKAAEPVLPNHNGSVNATPPTNIRSIGTPLIANGTAGSLEKAAPTNRQVFGATGRHTYTTGKVFWDGGNNRYGVCSASIVTAANKDTIVTAGHCCYDFDTKQWRVNKNFVFIPAYNNGAQPHGKWAARYMTAYNGWTVNQDYNYDVCFVNLHPNSANQHIEALLGSQSIASNYPRNALTYSFGYPMNLANGEVMQYCSGNAAPSKWGQGFIGQTIPCDMTGGCSGGPWLQNFDRSTGAGYVTSVNSFTINNIPNYMNGPYFESSIWSLYQQTSTK